MSDGTFSRSLTPSTTTRVVAAIRGLLGLGWPVWVLLAFGALAIFGPAAAPHNPDMFNVLDSLKAPSLSHPLGTDEFGRDVLSRMMVGARTLVTVSVVATIGTVVLGVLWGLTAAYLGGIREEFLMRTVDITVAVPELLDRHRHRQRARNERVLAHRRGRDRVRALRQSYRAQRGAGGHFAGVRRCCEDSG